MALSFGFVSFILANFVMLAQFQEANYLTAKILLIVSISVLAFLTKSCQKLDN